MSLLPPVTQQELVHAKAAEGDAADEVVLATTITPPRTSRGGAIGFTSELDREFLEKLINGEGRGALVAARSLAAPVGEIAAAIRAPGRGVSEASARHRPQKAKNIVAQLQAKVAKFALAPPEVAVPEPSAARRAGRRKACAAWSSRSWSSSSVTPERGGAAHQRGGEPGAPASPRPRSCSTRSIAAGCGRDRRGGRD